MSEGLNVLYLHSHDTGRCMEPYGYPVPMPAYRALAETGVMFRQAFSAAPTCSPSRAALLTGESPHSAGMLGLAHRGFTLTHPGRHLAQFLKEHGYRTVLAGHQHLTRDDPKSIGYETVLDASDRQGHTIAANAVGAITELAAASRSAPFFLDVGFEETHRPFPEVPARAGDWVAVLPTLPDVEAIRTDVAAFHASLRVLDQSVGRVLNALEQTGLDASTIVLLTTDHGPAFPGMKSTLTDRGLGVGLLIRVPGSPLNGFVSDALVSHLDIYPTLCHLLGIAQPGWLQGISLTSLLDGSSASVRTEVFGEVTYHAAYEPQRAIRTRRWTLIRRFSDHLHAVMPNVDPSPTLDVLIQAGWDQQLSPVVQLFDNVLDPIQVRNRADQADLQPILTSLQRDLEAWMRRTGDPLLAGPVPLPPGAVANLPSDRSPDGPLYRASVF